MKPIRGLLRRISSLYLFHHGNEWHVDFKKIIEKALSVHRKDDRSRWVDWERYSNRQQTRMSLGGVVGRVAYEGNLEPYWFLLRLGELVHVGKACTFGMGKYRLKVEIDTS